MEGLRVSKLEGGQQWGKNTSSRDKVQWGRRPPFIEGKKSNCYAHNPHKAVLPLVLMVLPLGIVVLQQRVAVLLLASGTKKLHPGLPPQDLGRVFGPERYYHLGAMVVLLWSGTTAQEPR